MQFILGSDSLTAFVKGKPYTVNRSAEIFNAALNAVRNDSEDEFLEVMSVKATVAKMFSDMTDVQVVDNRVMYGNREITGLLARRVFEMLEHNLNIKPLLNFIANLMKNPSKRAVGETFGFVDACKLPITEDGCILAYRRINSSYFDQHSNSVPNKLAGMFSPQETKAMPIKCGKNNEVRVSISPNGFTLVQMERNTVDEDKNNTCSVGLHACSYEYLNHFGGARIIVVKINPKDICSVPADYNNSKLRTCSYEIIEEMQVTENNLPIEELSQAYASKVQTKKMNKELADALRDDHNRGYSMDQLQNNYNLSRRQVMRILNWESWVN